MLTDRNLKIAVVVGVIMQLSTMGYMLSLKETMVKTTARMEAFEKSHAVSTKAVDDRITRLSSIAGNIEKSTKAKGKK